MHTVYEVLKSYFSTFHFHTFALQLILNMVPEQVDFENALIGKYIQGDLASWICVCGKLCNGILWFQFLW